MNLSLVILAAVLLAAAVYAQREIPRYTAERRNILLARLVLAVAAAGCGVVSAAIYSEDAMTALFAFLAGFGAVHVPAAFILLIKRARRAPPT